MTRPLSPLRVVLSCRRRTGGLYYQHVCVWSVSCVVCPGHPIVTRPRTFVECATPRLCGNRRLVPKGAAALNLWRRRLRACARSAIIRSKLQALHAACIVGFAPLRKEVHQRARIDRRAHVDGAHDRVGAIEICAQIRAQLAEIRKSLQSAPAGSYMRPNPTRWGAAAHRRPSARGRESIDART